MREFKFRGKINLTGRWVEGTGINNILGQSYITKDSPFGYEVHPESVGQFSGLEDKNGVEVYEGDILRYQKNNKTYQVVFKDGIFWGEGNNGCGCAAHFFPACEIVGNIHDNPELMKGGDHE